MNKVKLNGAFARAGIELRILISTLLALPAAVYCFLFGHVIDVDSEKVRCFNLFPTRHTYTYRCTRCDFLVTFTAPVAPEIKRHNHETIERHDDEETRREM